MKTPIPLDNIDTESDRYSLSLLVAGKGWYRFKDCVATKADLDESEEDGGTTISGVHNLYNSSLLYYCAPKTIVFVNQEWLNRSFSSWCLRDGVLRFQSPSGAVGRRLYHPRLPGVEFKDDMVDFLVGSWTHHKIAKYLADMLSMDVIITTPDMPIIDTFTISSGQAWFDAVKANFTMWGCNIQVMPSSSGSGNPVIQILDIINDSGGITPVGAITIDPESVETISHESANTGDSSNVVDHCIVIGRASESLSLQEPPDYTQRKLSKFDWQPNCTVKSEVPVGDVMKRKQMGDYTGEFGLGEDSYKVVPVERYRDTQEIYRYYDPSSGEKDLLLKETRDTIDKDGILVHRVQVEHEFSKDYKPVGTTEREWIRTMMPGETGYRFVNAKNKHTSQEYYIKALNQALTTEITEELVIADKVKKDGKTYRDNPNPFAYIKRLDRTRTYVDKSSKTNQFVFPMTTKFARTFIDRAGTMLLKRKLDYDVLSATGKMDGQILQNPKPEDKKSNGDQFRREYFNGTPVIIGKYKCYQKSTTIQHQDITTDAIAEALAERAFYRRSGDVRSVTVKTSFPVPIGTLPIKVRLKSLSRDVNRSDVIGDAETMYPTGGGAGGDDQEYYLTSITEKIAMTDAENPNDSQLKMEQTLELSTSL